MTSFVGYRDSEQLPVVLTPWSLIHFLSGCAAKQSKRMSFTTWFIAHGLYETKDQIVRTLSTKKSKANSWPNTAGDQTCAMLGYLITPANSKIPFVPIWLGGAVLGHVIKVEGGL